MASPRTRARNLASLALLFMLSSGACIGTPEEFQNTGVIVFRNETQVSFIEVRIAMCGTAEYSDNQLGNLAEIPPGREFRLRLSPGCFDARIGFFTGAFADFPDIRVREDEESTIRVTAVP